MQINPKLVIVWLKSFVMKGISWLVGQTESGMWEKPVIFAKASFEYFASMKKTHRLKEFEIIIQAKLSILILIKIGKSSKES